MKTQTETQRTPETADEVEALSSIDYLITSARELTNSTSITIALNELLTLMQNGGKLTFDVQFDDGALVPEQRSYVNFLRHEEALKAAA